MRDPSPSFGKKLASFAHLFVNEALVVTWFGASSIWTDLAKDISSWQIGTSTIYAIYFVYMLYCTGWVSAVWQTVLIRNT